MKKLMHLFVLTGFTFFVLGLAGCEEQPEKREDGIKLVSVKVETAGGQVMEKQAEDEEAVDPSLFELPAVPVRNDPVVKITTNRGVIHVELFPDKAPKTVENFLRYVKDGFYDDTIFHRVMNGFMIQGGGFTKDLLQKPARPPIVNECGPELRNLRGTIAMARTSAPDSATCQFFINHIDNRSLDFDGPYKPGYAVFGMVIEGMDVVDRIARTPVHRVSPSLTHMPQQTVVIERIERVR